MIVSEKPVHTTPRWVRGTLVLLSLALLPLGVVYAQEPDYEAVAERLIEAVKARELTSQQASAMMGELARNRFAQRLQEEFGDREECDRDDGLERHFLEMGVSEEEYDGILEALERSGIRGERAQKVLGGVLRTVHEMRKEGDAYQMDPGMTRYLTGEAGLGREQIGLVQGIAKRILVGLKRGDRERGPERRDRKGGRRPSDEEIGRMKKELWAAVKAGKITERQADERLEGYLKRFKSPESKRAGADIEMIGRRIREAVARGEMTKEEGRKKMEEAMKRLRSRERDPDARRERDGRRRTDEEARYDAYAKRIYDAVKAGKISREEAQRALEGLKKRLAGAGEPRGKRRERERERPKRGKRGGEDERLAKYEAIEKEIWASVKVHKMSKKEALKKLASIKEAIFGGKERKAERGKQDRRKAPTREEMGRVKEKIWAAVKAGKITEEQAEERWKAYLKSVRR